MDTNRNYSQDFKDKALLLVQKNGKSVANVAKQLKMPQSTLYSWTRSERKQDPHINHCLGGSVSIDDDLDF